MYVHTHTASFLLPACSLRFVALPITLVYNIMFTLIVINLLRFVLSVQAGIYSFSARIYVIH